MKNLLFIILTITTMNAVGQNHLVGVRGGPNISNINPSNFTIQHEYRLGFSAGFSYEYLFKKHF